MFDRWRYPAALAAAVGIGFPALATAAASQTGGQDDGRDEIAGKPRSAPHALTRPARRFGDAIEVGVHEIRVEKRRRHRHRYELPAGVSQQALDAIGECESGGDPNAVSADGSYRGKYQFDYGTWASVGGHGDPASASEREQDYRAALLYLRAGSSPWPNCA